MATAKSRRGSTTTLLDTVLKERFLTDKPLYTWKLYEIIQSNRTELEKLLEPTVDLVDADADYDDSGKLKEAIFKDIYAASPTETVEFMYFRVAALTSGYKWPETVAKYWALRSGDFIFATPIMHNAGTTRNQLSSCFVASMPKDDASRHLQMLPNMYTMVANGGDVGIDLHALGDSAERSKSPKAYASLLEEIVTLAAPQKRRASAINVGLVMWHEDILPFIRMKRPGQRDRPLSKLFQTVWIPDLFMMAVKQNLDWYMFPGETAASLATCDADTFPRMYLEAVRRGEAVKSVSARSIFKELLTSIVQTGGPSIMFKDNINECNVHDVYGPITGSNLCTEIVQYHDADRYAACCLASINFGNMVNSHGCVDEDRFKRAVDHAVLGLNHVLDHNTYILPELKWNKESRSIGVGMLGVADGLFKMKLPYSKAGDVLARAYELLYYQSVTASLAYATATSTAFRDFSKSCYESKLFHFDYWNERWCDGKEPVTKHQNWDRLGQLVSQHGLANSIFIAQMPTATTALFMNVTEGCEPFARLIDRKKIACGEFLIKNKHLSGVDAAGWEAVRRNNGSLVGLEDSGITTAEAELFATVWDVPPETYMDVVAPSLPFIDQSVSLSLYIPDDEKQEYDRLRKLIFKAWRLGFKTAFYYCRMNAASRPIDIYGGISTSARCSRSASADTISAAPVTPPPSPTTTCESCE